MKKVLLFSLLFFLGINITYASTNTAYSYILMDGDSGRVIESKNEDIRKEEILEQYRHFINSDELMNSALRDLVDKIVVYKDNTMKISFKFGLGEPKKIRLF